MSWLLLPWLSLAGEPRLGGVPLAGLSALGVGEPVFSTGADQWRAPFSEGWVQEIVEDDAPAAQARYQFTLTTVGATLPALSIPLGDDASGDDGLVVVRRENVVLVVRGAHAVAQAERLLRAMLPESALGVVVSTAGSAEARDAFGRLVRR